jgi:hypothetical protein
MEGNDPHGGHRRVCEGHRARVGVSHAMVEVKQLCFIKLSQILIEQNYFHFHDTIYIQNEGLAMGAPTSTTFSEIYLQYIENTRCYNILIKHQIEGYFCYVYDILIVCKELKTNIHNLLDAFNLCVPDRSFILEEEVDNKINFLDAAIAKNDNILNFDMQNVPGVKFTTSGFNSRADSQSKRHIHVGTISQRFRNYEFFKYSKYIRKERGTMIIY